MSPVTSGPSWLRTVRCGRMAVAFTQVPLRFRPAYVGVVAVNWQLFLSWQSNKKFAALDQNADGVLTDEELLDVLVKTEGYDPEAAKKVVESADTDHDGTVSLKEWRDNQVQNAPPGR